ncbi:trimeric intracellular cation channel family protein [Fundidesulfovibrio soli]|uniref:trimeric intracellular cation channel family protein n=1 Tax=Fundidesulfovibrio soli TaxID=2922716 RepID=UPI001FAED2CF|nr:TRIC cation channel family protein [Fundidesulfovibrio soli]
MDAQPFQLPIFLDLSAVFLMALTGVIEAIRREFDIIGLCVLALATGVGGALIRDGVFLHAGVPAVLSDDRYLMVVAAAAVLGVAFGTRAVLSERLIAWVDAAALGAYAVVGVEKSLALGLGFAPAVLVGVVNSCGGGVLRDLFTGERPMVFKPGQFYAFAALIGCLVYIPLRLHTAAPPLLAALAAIVVTFGLRVLAITRNWTTAPVGERGLLSMKRKTRRKKR